MAAFSAECVARSPCSIAPLLCACCCCAPGLNISSSFFSFLSSLLSGTRISCCSVFFPFSIFFSSFFSFFCSSFFLPSSSSGVLPSFFLSASWPLAFSSFSLATPFLSSSRPFSFSFHLSASSSSLSSLPSSKAGSVSPKCHWRSFARVIPRRRGEAGGRAS